MADELANLPAIIAKNAPAAWVDTEQSLRTQLSQRLTVAFLGSASSGKDSAIRALFGVDFGDVSPIPGSTDRVKIAPLDESGQVLIVNAPGFGDVRADIDALSRRILDNLDIVVYVVNSEGGATIDERTDLEVVRASGRPVLVCLNKIDLIRPSERESFVVATLGQLGVDRRDAAIVAFDPLPQLASEPIGVEEVVKWIHDHLRVSGKDLLFAKQLRNKALACEPLLRTAARNAAIAGAVPIPGADMAIVTGIQIKLIRDVAAIFGAPVDRDVALFILGEVLAGGARGFLRWGLNAMKAAGWVPGGQIAEGAVLALSAVMAGATTYGVGRAAVAYFQNGRPLEADKLRLAFEIAANEWRRRRDLREGTAARDLVVQEDETP